MGQLHSYFVNLVNSCFWKAFVVVNLVVHMKSDTNSCVKNGKRSGSFLNSAHLAHHGMKLVWKLDCWFWKVQCSDTDSSNPQSPRCQKGVAEQWSFQSYSTIWQAHLKVTLVALALWTSIPVVRVLVVQSMLGLPWLTGPVSQQQPKAQRCLEKANHLHFRWAPFKKRK